MHVVSQKPVNVHVKYIGGGGGVINIVKHQRILPDSKLGGIGNLHHGSPLFLSFFFLSHYHQFNRKRVYCGIYQHNSYTVCLVYPLEKQIVNTHTISSALDVSTVNKQRSEV